MTDRRGLYLLLLSIHGLVRSRLPELGRDPDTGGQITYVLDLARALVAHRDVERVDLVTRLIDSDEVDDDYAVAEEPVADGVRILRIPCGPSKRYLRKEQLWPHLDSFVDNLVRTLRDQGRAPDLVHGHYADAGHVACRLSGLLDIPMAFTGHSLGRVKRQRLLDGGMSPEVIEKRYQITRRIEAEETSLNHAAFVVASTNQEVRQQYELYDDYRPRGMLVIPPGVDLGRFAPPRGRAPAPSVALERLRPFLYDLRKPIVLAISRADPRKNIGALVRAFGENRTLRKIANLVVVAGNREDLHELDSGAKEVLEELLYLVDRYDLYGSVAYPKHHEPDDVPVFYRLAARSKGVFVNPALTEPFGLTLLEAAASGLPVVSTDDGGPRDIIGACKNGVLIDPLDTKALGDALLDAFSDRKRWEGWSRRGLSGSRRHFSWSGHVDKYMRAVRATVSRPDPRRKFYGMRSRLITADRLLVCDIDNTLTGDRKALRELLDMLRDAGEKVAFGIATGRSLALTREVLEEWKVPTPQLLITSVGTAIHYGPRTVRDRGWEKHIRYRWRPERLREVMAKLPGLKPQGPEGQDTYKISYEVDPEKIPSIPAIRARLRRARQQARIVYSHAAFLDVLPIRASKGMALRYFCLNWGVPPERCLVAGDSGNDEDMLSGQTLAAVVGNRTPELDALRGRPRIYFADAHHARGVIEAIDHYDFMGTIRAPNDELESNAERHSG
jgi:sucrose-phosphate synthase